MIKRLRNYLVGSASGSQLFRAVIGSAGLRIVGMGLGFLVGVQLARGLGPAGYGVYGLAMSVIALMMVPTEFGIPQLVTREVAAAQYSGDAFLLKRILRWSAQFVLVNAFILATLTAVFFSVNLYSVSMELKMTIWWGILLLPVIAFSNIVSASLRGLNHIFEGQLSEIFIRPAVFSLLLFLSLFLIANTSLTPRLAMGLNLISATISSLYVVVKIYPFLKNSISKEEIYHRHKNWLTSALPLALGEGLRVLSGHLAILVLGYIGVASEVGIYRVAFGVYVVAMLPPALLNAVCSPRLAALHQEGRRDAIQELNSWMTLFLLLAALLCLLPFAANGELILSIIFGDSYAMSNSILLALLLGELVSSLFGHPTIVLNMLRHDNAVAWFSAISLIINFFICVALVPEYGGLGAAIGVAIGQIIWRALSSWYALRMLGLHTSILAWNLKSLKRSGV